MTSWLLVAMALHVPFFPQQKNGCGAASVAMVAHYWQPRLGAVPSSAEIYQRLYDPSRGGIALSGMKSFLEELGLRAFTLHAEWNDLAAHTAKGRPAIVGLRKKAEGELHFVVVTGIEERHAWVQDPARRKPRTMKREDFEKQWRFGENWMLLAAPAGP